MAEYDDTSLTRRRAVLLAAGTAGAAALTAACSSATGDRGPLTRRTPADPAALPSTGSTAPGCVLTAEAGEGPYYLDLDKVRSDVTEGRGGVPVRLDLTVVRMSAGCRPLADAAVDIWQADSSGTYSTGRATFLRGTQITDAGGRAVFRTIVPGWYAGLAPHIHFKVRPDAGAGTTSQFFFPEDLLLRAYALAPYDRRRAPKHPNERDDRYRAAGAAMTLKPVADGRGYRASYTVGIA
ncbi:intradiol ring-cleavage dioxygenase [Streptomyces sp. NPDC058623]|uniref:dioxygenase family protein n=1 Tax=Streptomyces sp. NPDC058623 TaxID=3346563 RepID=UPI003668B25E